MAAVRKGREHSDDSQVVFLLHVRNARSDTFSRTFMDLPHSQCQAILREDGVFQIRERLVGRCCPVEL